MMGLMVKIDAAKDYSDKIRKRIRAQGVDASLRDIEDELRELLRKDNSRIRSRLIKTQLLNLYQQDAEALEKDLTKLIVLEPVIPKIAKEHKRELLRVLWAFVKSSLGDLECDSVVQDIQHMAELNRKYAKNGNDE